jgi:hypothetical protein
MSNIKYISLENLQKSLKNIIDEVYNESNEYIVMVDKEPKAKISSIENKKGKEILIEDEVSEEELKKFA